MYDTTDTISWTISGQCRARFFSYPLPGPHAKEETHRVERLDQQFVQDKDQREGNHGDDQELGQDANIPTNDEKADDQDNCLMEQVERQYCLVAVGQYLVVEVQVLGSKAQHKDDCAPTGNAPYDLIHYVYE